MHEGHRARLRQRFRESGLEGFAPHEVLELLLCYGRARGDVNPTAHALLDTFGSLRGVLEATPKQLQQVPGVGEETATLISLMLPLFRRYSLTLCEERRTIPDREAAEAYCAALLAGERAEHFYVICLDSGLRVLGRRLIARGTISEVAAYPRLVAEAVLDHNASGAILCHNHPGGICRPSEDDLAVTARLSQLLGGLGVRLADHIIIAGGEAWSMAAHGQLAPAGRSSTLLPADGRSRIIGGKKGRSD